MGLQQSDTLEEYITRIRLYLREIDPDLSHYSDTFLKNIFNARFQKRATQLIMAYEGFFTLRSKTPIIGNQDFYSWPTGFSRLQKLEIEKTDGRTVPLRRAERHEAMNVPPVSGGDDYLPNYRPIGDGLVLEPAPSSGGTAETLLESFDALSANADITAGADTTLSDNANELQEGSASLQIDKTGVASSDASVVKINFNQDLTGSTTVLLDMYFPTTAVLTASPAIEIRFGDGVPTNESIFQFDAADLTVGWNTLTLDRSNPTSTLGTGAAYASVPVWTINIFGSGASTALYHGILVDDMRQGIATQAANQTFLRLEYIGAPKRLGDGERLPAEFPVEYDELLVLDTVVAAMSSEAMQEGGQLRAIARERAEFDANWERYIDNRMISRQRVEPHIGHYENA